MISVKAGINAHHKIYACVTLFYILECNCKSCTMCNLNGNSMHASALLFVHIFPTYNNIDFNQRPHKMTTKLEQVYSVLVPS